MFLAQLCFFVLIFFINIIYGDILFFKQLSICSCVFWLWLNICSHFVKKKNYWDIYLYHISIFSLNILRYDFKSILPAVVPCKKSQHLWKCKVRDSASSAPLKGDWTRRACYATASWSGFLSGWQDKHSCHPSTPAAPTHRCSRAGACSPSVRRSLCVVSNTCISSLESLHTSQTSTH